MSQFEATTNDFSLSEIRFKQAALDFVLIEIQLGLTFASLVPRAEPRNSDKSRRNARNARKAYESALRFRKGISFTQEEKDHIEDGMKKLRAALQMLHPADWNFVRAG